MKLGFFHITFDLLSFDVWADELLFTVLEFSANNHLFRVFQLSLDGRVGVKSSVTLLNLTYHWVYNPADEEVV